MSNCSTIQEYTYESVDEWQIRLLFGIFYSTLWLAAVLGNLIVLYVVAQKQVSLSVRSVFIGCLAVSDLLVSLTSLPVTAITIFTRVWIFPALFCKLIGIFQGGSIFVSSFTLTAIAVDRCLLIVFPNREIITYHRTVFTVVTIWVLGYALALPTGLFSSQTSYEGICGEFCEESWPDYNEMLGRSNQRRLYGLSVLLLQFGIPAVICSVCYYMISRVMETQLERRRGHTLLKESENKLINRKRRANRMMITMVLGFTLAWMPLNAINLYRDLVMGFSAKPWFSVVFASCHVLAMTSSVVNPMIYSWFNPQFRTVIKSVLHKRSSTRKSVTTQALDEKANGSKCGTNQILISEVPNESKGMLLKTTCYQDGDDLL